MAMTLNDVPRGSRAVIVSIEGDDAIAQRLYAMGVLPGQQASVVAVAPMGDPITIAFASGKVSLRRAEAAAVTVNLCA